jgi:SAM-dependent methyltransferase
VLARAWDRLRGCPGEFVVRRCTRCGTIRTEPRLSLEELRPFYAANSPELSPAEVPASLLPRPPRDDRWAFLPWRHWVFPEAAPIAVGRPGRVLDIGCGHGELLDRLLALGWETWGIETDARAASRVSQRGHHVVTRELSADLFQGVTFDMVWMSHSLEHVQDPLAACRIVRTLLKPDGVLLLRIPRADGLLPRVMLADWYNLDVPRHLWHFSSESLRQLLAMARLDVVRLSTYSTWIDYAATARNAIIRRIHGPGPSISGPLPPWIRAWMKVVWVVLWRPLDFIGAGDRMFVVATPNQTRATGDVD